MDPQTWRYWLEFAGGAGSGAASACASWERWRDFLKDIGPTLGIVGAVAAWLVNKFLSWFVWICERFLKRYELMHALRAEIQSNSQGESYFYPGGIKPDEAVRRAEDLIEKLRANVGPYNPLMPYLPTLAGNPVYENALSSLSQLSRWVVWPVVRYYSASVQLVNQLADFRSDSYLALSQSRQADVIRQLWRNIGREVEVSARQAQRRLFIWISFYDLLVASILTLGAALSLGLFARRETLWIEFMRAVTPAVDMVPSCPLSSSNASP